ncbi:larval cuticle protein lcp-17 [Lasius niger]|uniref:Larval cuticle protein lcp-17 n=1 Tax=Lasius niger TaxID=67767 RepID=A0A0J7KML7_LASNI|nr:larval cuticle protein lcp-17 [Lasius niger]
MTPASCAPATQSSVGITITLYVLIKATVILAETKRLTTPTLNEYYKATGTTSTTTPRVTTLSYYPRPSKPLYSYKYNTDTGIQAQEDGYLNNAGTDQEALKARGSYSYTDNDGNIFQVSYTANEDGFQPEGAHLPTVPPLIKKALQYIAEHPEENEE